MVTPEFIFDVGSPNAYFAHRIIPSIEARTGASFRYVPCLLGGVFKATNNRSPMEANANVPAKIDYEMLEMRRFIARHGLTKFAMNPHFPVNTLLAMRCAVAADAMGRLKDYVDAAMRAMWEDGVKLDDAAAAKTVFGAAGFDGAALIAAAATAPVKAALIANTERAVARGVFGMPTFFVGDEMWFGKDRLRDVEEAIAAVA